MPLLDDGFTSRLFEASNKFGPFKSGAHIEEGEHFRLKFTAGKVILKRHLFNEGDKLFKIHPRHLWKIFDGFEPEPDEEELTEFMMDGAVPTPMGDEVEPDGVNGDGIPSWLMALGLI